MVVSLTRGRSEARPVESSAASIARHSQANGGAHTVDDFAALAVEWVTPLAQRYRGATVHEIPPNGQGIAALIAAYTVVDNAGIEHASPIAYLELVLVPVALAGLVVVPRERLRAALTPGPVAAGMAGFAAYTLVLAALDLAPAAPVAAVRETSVVIAVGLAAVFLHERVTAARAAGAVAVVAGVALLSF